MRTKSSIRIMITIIIKLVPLIPAMPFEPGLSSVAILSFGRMCRQTGG